MKEMTAFLLLLSSLPAAAQYNQQRANSNEFRNIQPLKLQTQQPTAQTGDVDPNVLLKKTDIERNNEVPANTKEWRSTSVTTYTGNRRVQSYQTFDANGNVIDSHASINLKSKKRK